MQVVVVVAVESEGNMMLLYRAVLWKQEAVEAEAEAEGKMETLLDRAVSRKQEAVAAEVEVEVEAARVYQSRYM
jgi:nucleotide-binding universal stress UspA family protein